MAMTMTQKLLARKAGLDFVEADQIISCRLDLMLGNDITAPVAIDQFSRLNLSKTHDPEKIVLIPDHFTPNKDIKSASQAKKMRDFARKMSIPHYYEVGRCGIEHAFLPEQGLVTAGDCVIGADSHTCTYGALGAFATGVGSTDLAAGMASGTAWFKVPRAIKVIFSGRLSPWVSGKDVILHLIGLIGVDGALYKSLEFSGDISALSMDDRLCICNMAIEAGAKNGIFPVDDITREYLAAHGAKSGTVFEADPDAVYERTVEIDLCRVPLTVARPSLPENTARADSLSDVRIDQAVIGSCTNGRISDMRAAAAVLKGRSLHPEVRCIVIPATVNIWRQALAEGLLDIFAQAGCVVSTPTCGPCLGGHMGILAENEVAVSTTNRNFVGRMGHVTSKVYLASPAVAAASAVMGRIAVPNELPCLE